MFFIYIFFAGALRIFGPGFVVGIAGGSIPLIPLFACPPDPAASSSIGVWLHERKHSELRYSLHGRICLA